MGIHHRTRTLLLAILVTLMAAGLRAYAADHLYIDYDEPVYLDAAIEYAHDLSAGKIKALAWSENNFEHPDFYKIVYALDLMAHPPLPNLDHKQFVVGTPMTTNGYSQWGMANRWVSVLFGALAAGGLALLNPLAGAFMAVETFGVKFTSEIYLEALPVFSSFLCVWAYSYFYKATQLETRRVKSALLWLAFSAACLGISVASKYTYGLVGAVIVVHAAWAVIEKKLPARYLAYLFAWGCAAGIVFLVCDPYLWHHTQSRLMATLAYHADYPTSPTVKAFSYPFWQPFIWLIAPFAQYNLKPDTAFPIRLDAVIFALALIGLPRTYTRQRIYFIWLVLGMAFLLVWGTKWPQYILIILVPYSVAAAQGVAALYDFIKSRWGKRKLRFVH